MNEVLFSSNTDDWATPQDLFDALDAEFHFTLDPCSSEQNHKCDRYFTKEDNGLLHDWGGNLSFSTHPMVKKCINGLKNAIFWTERTHNCCSVDSGKNRHQVFSRFYYTQDRNSIHKRSVEIWEQ